MTGDCHVQFSESARVKFPRATQLNKADDPVYYTYAEKSTAENTKVFSAIGIIDELPQFSTAECQV